MEKNIEPTDEDLMLAAKKGDTKAFESLYKRYYQAVVYYFYRNNNIQSVCEELAQETFMKIYKAKERYNPSAAFTTYLYTVARNLLINYNASCARKERAGLPYNLTSNNGSPDGQASNRELVSKVLEALDSLTESQKQAVILTRFQGLDYEQTAQILGLKINALKSLLNRARKTLCKKVLT